MIVLEQVTRRYGDNVAVDAVSLEIGSGEICVIVGTSGSGKTTLLRMINRLVEPSEGRILIDGQDTREIPAYTLRRRIGYAIQGHGLFPHRTVAQNIATVPSLLGWDRAKTTRRVDELLTLFQLDPAQFRDRLPAQLSGGEQQRVGVARALAAEPLILLMDEPFGALDPVIRGKAQDDLLAIQRHFGTTIVLVTHDMEEAMRLGTRIAVMQGGKLIQFDTPQNIVANPATDFVAELVGNDRAFRMLGLATVEGLVEPGEAEGQPVSADASLRTAYAELLWSGRAAAPVLRDGKPVGRITAAALAKAAARPQ
jgi:osmoprotectant transport system ATP-binding protein